MIENIHGHSYLTENDFVRHTVWGTFCSMPAPSLSLLLSPTLHIYIFFLRFRLATGPSAHSASNKNFYCRWYSPLLFVTPTPSTILFPLLPLTFFFFPKTSSSFGPLPSLLTASFFLSGQAAASALKTGI